MSRLRATVAKRFNELVFISEYLYFVATVQVGEFVSKLFTQTIEVCFNIVGVFDIGERRCLEPERNDS